MIRELSDAQVLEIQLIENLQRDDLSPLEEAEGYRMLHTAVGERAALSADEIAQRIGKSRRYVYNRLKLLDTAPEVQAALREGRIDASRALLIGSIRRMSDQVKALELATQTGYDGQPLSVRALQQRILRTFFLEIREIPWSETADGLAGHGACSSCPKRSDREAEQDLFDQTEPGEALCLDADCHAAKLAAHTEQQTQYWAEQGAIYKTNDQATEEELLRWHNEKEGHKAIRAGQVREDLPAPHTGKTIKQLLGKDAKGITTYAIAFEPREPEVLYYDRAQVYAALKAKGIDLALAGKGRLVHHDDGEADAPNAVATQLQRQQQQQIRQRTEEALLTALQSKTFMTSDVANKHVLEWLAKDFIDYNAEDIAPAFNIDSETVDAHDALCREAERGPEPCIKIIAAQCVLIACVHQADTTISAAAAHFLGAVGISRQEIEAKVQADLQAEQAAQQAALKANAEAKAQAQASPSPAAPKPKAKKPKASAQEASQGIAQALQQAQASEPAASEPEPPAPPALGDRVEVLASYGQAKRHGKQGKITSGNPSGWWVNFGGRAGSDLIAPEHLRKVAA